MNTQLFGRAIRVTVSALSVFLCAAIERESFAGTSILLAFSSDHCGHCEAMKPTLNQLENNGTPIRRVNVSQEPELARRHGIREVPTFVVLSSGREVTRLVGTQSAQDLVRALEIDLRGPLLNTGSSVDSRSVLNAPATKTPAQASKTGAPATLPKAEAMPSASLAEAIERARAATVRLRVYEGRGFGVGTGTVIDRHGDESLVLTCGHLFRETKLEARIDVDLFIGGQIKTVPGKVIDYDSENRDIALVVIRPGFDIQPVPVINPDSTLQTGQSVFSFGCDHGDDPSRRDTRITGIDIYNQNVNASNIEIAVAPVDGRSGGGLFDQSGRLIGVCNAADYKGDVGIYTGPGSIKWQLDRVQLAHLYQSQPTGPSPTGLPPTGAAPAVASAAAAPPIRQPETRLALLEAPANAPAAPIQSAGSRSASATEMIVIVRDPNQPGGQRVMTIDRPSDDLVHMISRHANN